MAAIIYQCPQVDSLMATIKRFSKEELLARDSQAGLEGNEYTYTETELDELYEVDPIKAMRLSREQEMAKRHQADVPADPNMPPPDREELIRVLNEARRILLKDGGDLELIEIKGSVVRVRMKGNCVGCPNSVLDLKNVIERLVKKHFPQVTEVVNTF